MPTEYTLEDFALAYCALSEQHAADVPGSAEYRRVRREWLQADRPEPIGFIREAANRPPGQPRDKS
jgi:hypothetical protein